MHRMDKNNGIELKLEELRQKEAEDLARMLAEKHGLPYADLSRMTIDLDALKLVPEDEARAAKMAIFQKVAKKLQIAVDSINAKAALIFVAAAHDIKVDVGRDGKRVAHVYIPMRAPVFKHRWQLRVVRIWNRNRTCAQNLLLLVDDAF